MGMLTPDTVKGNEGVITGIDESSSQHHPPQPTAPTLTEKPPVLERLKVQYSKCMNALVDAGLVNDPEFPYIKARSGKEYPVTQWDEIVGAIPEEDLEFLEYLRNPMLVITPFALGINEMIERLNDSTLLTIFNNIRIQSSNLHYFPEEYLPINAYSGKGAKSRILQKSGEHNFFPGWQVTIIEAVGQSLRETSRVDRTNQPCSVSEYLSKCLNHGFSPLTLEEILMMHLQAQVSGIELDEEIGTYALGTLYALKGKHGKITRLEVPYVKTRMVPNILVIDGKAPTSRSGENGVRIAYRVYKKSFPKTQRSKSPKRTRSRTIPLARLTADEVRQGIALIDHLGSPLTTRGECVGGERPCPRVSCKYHLYLDVNPETGSIQINNPDVPVWEMADSCALDIADRGGAPLEEVGEMMELTRERIRQIEVKALKKLVDSGLELPVDKAEFPPPT